MHKIVAYYYELVYRLLRWIWTKSSLCSCINGVILMYHHIFTDDDFKPDSCHHSINQLERTIVRLQHQGYVFVSMSQALEIIRTKSNKKFVVVTFDDVPDDAYMHAVPLLRRLNIPFVFYVTVGYIGTPGYLTIEQIRELDKDPLCSVGAHTMTHSILRQDGNALYELVQSKLYLETSLGHQIDYLAYPYGRPSSVSKAVITMAAKAGYKCAVGTVQSPLTDWSSRELFYLPRMVIS